MVFLQQSDKLFIGYINDKPVVTGILFEYDDAISGIFRLFTCKQQREKGFGTNITTYLLNFAKKKKKQACDTCCIRIRPPNV